MVLKNKSKPVSNGGMLGMILAGVAALIAGVVGFNEISKSKSGIKGNTTGAFNSVKPANPTGKGARGSGFGFGSSSSSGYTSAPKKSGDCGCGA